MRWIELRFRLPFEAPQLRVACAALTTVNRVYLREQKRSGVPVPPLYSSGVRYVTQYGPEQWRTIPDALQARGNDCKTLACWRAAELREQGIAATAVPVRKASNLFHIVVRWPDGRIEDPSKRLGMGARVRGSDVLR